MLRAALLALIIVANSLAAAAAEGPQEIPLWPKGAPGAVGTEALDQPTLTYYPVTPTEKVAMVGNVSQPTITSFPAPAGTANGTAVVICPGGGYGHLAMDHEGKQIAEWLNTLGISGFVLKYRLAPRYKHPAPLQDVQRAIRLIRSRAKEWHVDVNRVGVMGFSAGGHLASTAATHFDLGNYRSGDRIERSSCRPDFAILCYPVISFLDPSLHTGSRDNLTGGRDPYLIRHLSNETQVTPQTCPTFLWHTAEDRGVYPQNSLLFFAALSQQGVPGELHVYERGRHGLGLAKDEPATSDWPNRCAAWLKGRGLLETKYHPVFSDPGTVSDPDFFVQGEYAGEVMQGMSSRLYGVQVVALGQGEFEAAAFAGGLPGQGGGSHPRHATGKRDPKTGIVHLGGEFRAQIVAGRLFLENLTGAVNDGTSSVVQIGELSRVERRSPTLGLPAPDQARILFDGSTPFNFDKGRMLGEPVLPGGVTSHRKFQDCRVHLEFRTPFQPQDRGQKRGNSGCYLQGRYEVQILDSFGLSGKNNECGGVYEIQAPAVNMCYPPLVWQTYDIEYTAARYDSAGKKTAPARITVHHNGVKVQDNLELLRSTRSAPVAEGPEPGPLYLQDHGNPVRYRNIWVLERSAK